MANADGALPRHVGRFQIRRLLGHGGFGIVFLAYDAALDREAALKLPRAEILLSSKMRDRFVREAQAAAMLDHPGIVPIYETGELGLVSYILSAYCKGPTLAQWLKECKSPVPPKTAARIVAHLANAVQHAHDRGVLHRDLKPSNVLLEPSDELTDDFPFVPRLSDFGLAKRLEPTDDATRPGTLLGTPRYMAPEQVRGDERGVGVQTDVYALGVILYELLAGAPPYVGGTDQETFRKIENESPSLMLLRDRAVPLDLETVCFKSLEKEPAARYQSARELADDLRRFLAGDSVCARSIGRAGRFVRWCRRRPLVAALSLGLAIAILVGAFAATSQWLRAERNLTAARASAVAAKQNLKQAEEALLDFAWIVEESALWSEESISLRNEIDARLKQYHDRLEEAHATNGDATPIRAAIHSFIARSAALNGVDAVRVDEEFRQALSLWHEVVAANPDAHAYRRASALCLYSYAIFLRDQARAAGSHDGIAEMRKLFAATAAEPPNSAAALADLATVLLERGNVHFNARENDLARDMHALGLLAAEELVVRFPKKREYAVVAATLSRVLANEERTEGHHEEALAAARRSQEILEPFLSEARNDRRFNEELAEVYRLIGYQLRFLREYAEAAELLNRSIGLWERLLASAATRVRSFDCPWRSIIWRRRNWRWGGIRRHSIRWSDTRQSSTRAASRLRCRIRTCDYLLARVIGWEGSRTTWGTRTRHALRSPTEQPRMTRHQRRAISASKARSGVPSAMRSSRRISQSLAIKQPRSIRMKWP
ncbi:MAG: serine/threonine-protein kinase [Pirellulales bacterium]